MSKGVSSETVSVSWLPSRVHCPCGRGGVAAHLSSPSLSTKQANTHFATQGNQAHTQSQSGIYHCQLHYHVDRREKKKKIEHQGRGLCSFTEKNMMARDFANYVAETD